MRRISFVGTRRPQNQDEFYTKPKTSNKKRREIAKKGSTCKGTKLINFNPKPVFFVTKNRRTGRFFDRAHRKRTDTREYRRKKEKKNYKKGTNQNKKETKLIKNVGTAHEEGWST